MIDPKEFRQTIIWPALQWLSPDVSYSVDAANLLLGTALQESLLKHTRQVGGPALGYFQMEPNTHDDIWLNFLKYRRPLAQKIVDLIGGEPTAELLETDHLYAAAMCRVHYLRCPEPIPSALADQAALWKLRYNTPLGAGTEREYMDKWQRYVR